MIALYWQRQPIRANCTSKVTPSPFAVVLIPAYLWLRTETSIYFWNIFIVCDRTCGCGYNKIQSALEGDSKNTSKPGQGIEKCKAECDDREGCTSFEYNHTGEEEYECKTYTNGDGDVVSTRAQGYHWTSCISHIQGIIFFQYMLILGVFEKYQD